MNTKQLDEDEFFAFIRELANEPVDEMQPDQQQQKQENLPITPPAKSTTKSPTSSPPKKASNISSLNTTVAPTTALTAKPILLDDKKPSAAALTPKKEHLLSKVHPKLQRPMGTELWVDKYRPQSRKALIGQNGAASPANKLFVWLSSWHQDFAAGTCCAGSC